jgi:hypothetical protein
VTGLSCTCKGFFAWQRCTHHALLLKTLGWLPNPGPALTSGRTGHGGHGDRPGGKPMDQPCARRPPRLVAAIAPVHDPVLASRRHVGERQDGLNPCFQWAACGHASAGNGTQTDRPEIE